MPEKKLFERLPKSVRPTHYDLTLKPNLKSFTFAGEETIKVHVAKATRTIILNTLELEIPSAKFITADGSKIACENIELSKEDETATLTFPAELPEGEGQLCIEFLGVLNDKLKGFYRSKYTADGGVQYGAVTQFEATDARRAFPCWDEPASKATFDITLVVPNDRVALSNMNVIATTPLEGDTNLKVVKFATTPVMSTYLVACIVGEYDYVEGKSADGILVRVYTPVGKKDQGLFALDVAVKVLPYYKDYFNIPYPLPKIDLIAIADFASGAMENWGLVTYRESCLLVDPHNTSAAKKQWIALVVGHELAHQWFGNLVTMEWWTHLWLNEGFASWIEFLCVDYLFPQYQIWTQFVTDTHSRALELDALRNSHPIEVPVGHPAEVDEIFDDISYNKGASVIRMLHNYIGDECFRKGMNQYLTKHQYKNTFTEDLWECLESASNKPIGTMMSTWTKQTGFPVIKVVARQDGTSRILQITQERFIADGSSDLENSQWIVPINISTSQNPDKILKQVTLQNKSMEVVVENVKPDEWVKLNPGTVGFYRVQYSPEMLETFHSAIRDKTLPPLDRLGLLDDLFALVQAGHISTVEVLKLMQNYATEDNYTVWAALCNCLGRLSTLLSHTDYRSSFMAYSCGLMGSITNRLGWDPEKDENHLHTLLRGLVLDRMGLYGDAAVIVEAKRRFESHAAGSSILCADLRSPVYRTVLSVGDEKTFDSMLRLYREADLHEEKDRISRALGSLQEVSLIRRVLDFAMSEEVRSQDTVFVIISVAMNPCGRDMAWQFFREKWEELISRYQGGFLISRLVKYITENFASEEKAQEVEGFFAENSVAAAERTVQQSIENIRLNANWLSRDSASIKSWLQDRK